MGKRRGKRVLNRTNQSFGSPGSPSTFNSKNANEGEEVIVEYNAKPNPPKHAYQTVYMSNENVTSLTEKSAEHKDAEKRSSYQSLIDGGAYQQFHSSHQSLPRGNISTASKYDFESAGDRVLTGSRSISHRSLFSDDKSFSGFPKPLRTSSRNCSEIQWEDFENHDEDGVHIRRMPSNGSIVSGNLNLQAPKQSNSRVRTVSSSSERPHSSQRVDVPILSMSSSHRNLNSAGQEEQHDVRTYHADSDYLQNHLSKLSIHSNNDEFVLVGGHPPVGGGRSRTLSRTSSISENLNDVGRSVSQLSVNSVTREVPISRSSSKHTIGSTTNTDDRLILAAHHSQSPEAEGLLSIPTDKTMSRASSRASGVGFVEIPTLYSHPDEKFDGEEVDGVPFRPTSEHSFTPTAPSNTRQGIRRSSSSSSSILAKMVEEYEKKPENAMLVTSALTPVATKRQIVSLSRSDDSIALETPQTVQRASDAKRVRPQNSEVVIPNNTKITMEMAVQTGDSIRLRQNQVDVLSAHAYLPAPESQQKTTKSFSMSPTKTASYVPAAAKNENSLRARLRHISDVYNNDDEMEANGGVGGGVEKKRESTGTVYSWDSHKSSKTTTIETHQPSVVAKKLHAEVVEIPKSAEIQIPIVKSSDRGDTIRKHVPRGRIRDLADTFNKLSAGTPAPVPNPKLVFQTENYEPNVTYKLSSGPSSRDMRQGHSSSRLDGSSSSALRSSTQTIRSDDRRSSSLHLQPHVYSRNTFLTGSRSGHSANGNSSEKLEKLPVMRKSSDTSASHRKSEFAEVPIRREIPIQMPRRARMIQADRAKTQEVPSAIQFDKRYESRALSGELPHENEVFGLQKPLFAASRDAFGRETAEDLSGHQDLWASHRWEPRSSQTNLKISPTRRSSHYSASPIRSPKERGDYLIPSKLSPTPGPVAPAHNYQSMRLPPQSIRGGQPYSPPITEDAGSRITYHTASTLHDDLFAGTGTEDSSIRGKIDRMFDFVESDDSRKTLQVGSYLGSQASTDTIGTNNRQREEYKRTPLESRLKSPERRNTVTGSEHMESVYSLAKYREVQKEQLRNRLPSSDEPQFFRSPLLSAPHAGQSMHAYRAKDLMGTPTAGEKVRLPSSSSRPTALATSTPIDSPQGRTFLSTKERFSPDYHHHTVNTTNPPNETFVSSISGVSAMDKQAEATRKINRLTYMIENTQQQMSMNEAALVDAVKKGRRSQEIAAHRSILITRETLRLQRTELRRLHAFSAVRRPPPPIAKELKGAVIFKNIVVHLNKLFVSRLTVKDDNSYSFVGLFKFGHQVEATELVPLRVFVGEETGDKLHFEKQIQFSDVPIDFMVTIEIYAMRMTPLKPVEHSLSSSLANKCKSLIGPPQKKLHPPSTETAFKFRGRLVLDRDASGDRCLYLDDVTYPLEGTVTITTECSRLPESFEQDFRGFLTMFHTVSNMASWERYWAVLRRGVVFFWKYPDDEQMGREPKMQIDLTKCTNNTIEKCGFDLCPRANSFVIEILVDTEENDGTVGSVVEKKRVLLSCDSPEMLSQWLFTLNQTLDVIRGPI